ncbi:MULTISPECIES: DUF4870 domain-containing protein [unclassified Curtobacterium]|uniref:DUF4870 domain-containing protein n=1 Tax=unclassified Curtobacterium TaxID=257496 RepID=UPI0008DE0102|nr:MULTISPECIES: DUF4870 domain-containing protein [unclassified Curtobacterium]OIH94941.1 hypothetical protein BIU92_06140 [Curtobacterium sp. MCBA15_003]OII12954.1 hypothetical protein BIU97_03220 [Curtobacterium sp. MCBA15_009]OII32102.1 hypothetical protein BIU94_01685 [Curtobacterium sp. MMLR14_006]
MTYGQQPGGPEFPPGYRLPEPMRPEDQRLWATLTHVGAIFSNFIVPLVAYLVLRDRGQFVREHTRNALNFHITMGIAYLVSSILIFVLIGLVLLPIVAVVTIVFSIIAAIAANQGQLYRYPLAIEFIKE